MFSIFQKQKATTAIINDTVITVAVKETLLQAALRQGIDFPNSCRVGGCASCKCKLLNGRIKALTDASYVLTAQELDAGYVLACQSVPLSDIRVSVDLAKSKVAPVVAGRVIGQQKLTDDITCLAVRLDQNLQYRAGHYAEITLESLPGVTRSYSFTSPAQPDGQCSFFVRKVPDGRFSSHVNETPLIGTRVELKAVEGSFWLRPAQAPLLLVAGGSGLGPILAIMQEALAVAPERSLTLLFGARQQNDLYALDQINAIARQWQGSFRFIPALSAEPIQSSWSGERGLVTQIIPALIEPGAHAYLCGPPAMVDSVLDLLIQQGLAKDQIFADRFTTAADSLLAVA